MTDSPKPPELNKPSDIDKLKAHALLTNAKTRPSFAVVDSDGRTFATLEHCFLARSVIDVKDIPNTLTAKDGQVYRCVYDRISLPRGEDIIKVIISFQKHTYGYFAVIRNLNEKES